MIAATIWRYGRPVNLLLAAHCWLDELQSLCAMCRPHRISVFLDVATPAWCWVKP